MAETFACSLCGRPLLAPSWHESAEDAFECAARTETAVTALGEDVA